MATRFYIQNAAPTYDPATARGTWSDSTGYDISRKLSPTKSGAIATNRTDKAASANPHDVLSIKMISEPLAASTISGTVNWVVGSDVQHVICYGHHKVHIFVTQGDSDTVRGTLLANDVDADGTNDIDTTYDGHGTNGGTAKAISSLAITAGDRIVIELGIRYYQAGKNHWADLSYGGTGSTDLTVGGDASANPSWFEFSGTIAESAPTGNTNFFLFFDHFPTFVMLLGGADLFFR